MGVDAGGAGFALPAAGAQDQLMASCVSGSPALEHMDAAGRAFCACGLWG